MVRVMATGVFDIIHLGHLHYLEESKKLGDELIVIVATDKTVRKQKHEPITPEKMRLELVSALKPVDKAFLGHEGGDIFKVVQELKPDIITIGYDQPFEERTLEGELEKRGLRVQVVRMPHLDHDLDGTRKIIRKVIEFHEMSKKLSEVEKK
ncbi:MAG TPA: adenylyltransferase/cytidyltransferase family protein [Thermoplasmata archaeon]|nr:adenylyltransferase/cytidyltransferase family protein [Thermoplasmata archaeon]